MSHSYEKSFRNPGEYQVPFWIARGGEYMAESDEGRGKKLDPTAFDPAAPNAMRPGGKVSVGEATFPDPGDLKNLLFIDAQAVRDFHTQLEAAAISAEEQDKLVLGVVGTGGTIAMSLDQHGVLVPKIKPDQLLDEAAGRIHRHVIPVSLEAMRIDSSQYEGAYTGDLLIVTYYLWKQASPRLKEHLLALLVLHGTDTAVESATNFKVQAGPSLPLTVGFVAAQKSIADKQEGDGVDPDSPRKRRWMKKPNDVGLNIYTGIYAAGILHDEGVNTVFLVGGGTDGQILNPGFAKKASDSETAIFDSPYGPEILTTTRFMESGLSESRKDHPGTFLPLICDGYNSALRVNPPVGQDPCILKAQIEAAIDSGVSATVLETFGAFTANAKVLSILMEARERTGLLLIASSPFPMGSADHDYASSRQMKEAGFTITSMSPHAMMAVYNLAVRLFGNDQKRIKEFIEKYDYAGMQPHAVADQFTPGTPPELEAQLKIAAESGTKER